MVDFFMMRSTEFLKKLVLPFCLLAGISLQAQQVQITLGPDEIGENQAWTISITVQNGELKKYDNFPEIVGFRKRGTSNQSSTTFINGQASSTQSIIMTYLPTKQGTFTIPDFTLRVNEKPIRVAG